MHPQSISAGDGMGWNDPKRKTQSPSLHLSPFILRFSLPPPPPLLLSSIFLFLLPPPSISLISASSCHPFAPIRAWDGNESLVTSSFSNEAVRFHLTRFSFSSSKGERSSRHWSLSVALSCQSRCARGTPTHRFPSTVGLHLNAYCWVPGSDRTLGSGSRRRQMMERKIRHFRPISMEV